MDEAGTAPLASVTCLTVIAESVLQAELLHAIERCGARGWTVSMAEGKGPGAHGVSGIEGGNVRIEVLASAEVIRTLWQMLERDYFPHYAVSAWEYDVKVSRAARYAGD